MFRLLFVFALVLIGCEPVKADPFIGLPAPASAPTFMLPAPVVIQYSEPRIVYYSPPATSYIYQAPPQQWVQPTPVQYYSQPMQYSQPVQYAAPMLNYSSGTTICSGGVCRQIR